MAGFFRRLVGVSAPEEKQVQQYTGHLTEDHFVLSQGSPLGLGEAVPQTLAYDAYGELVGLCTPEGHVRIFGPDLDICLLNPEAPVRPRFLLFPRPGLLLAITSSLGLASSSHSGSSPTSIAQWWNFSAKTRPAHQAVGPQSARLGFTVTCTAKAEEAGLVFLGSAEGDVHVFDAGQEPRVGNYCIKREQLAVRHIVTLEVAPRESELLIGTEGTVLLWSFEKHQKLRTFAVAGVLSMVWHDQGSEFLVVSCNRITAFRRDATTPLAYIPLPGGESSSANLMRWHGGDMKIVPHGEVLLHRGPPNPKVLSLTNRWSQVDDLVEDASSAVLCESAPRSGFACGCGLPLLRRPLDEIVAYPLLLAAVGDPTRLVVRTLPPVRPLGWFSTWGSLELTGTSVHALLTKDTVSIQSELPLLFAGPQQELASVSSAPGSQVSDKSSVMIAPQGTFRSEGMVPFAPQATFEVDNENAEARVAEASAGLGIEVSLERLESPPGLTLVDMGPTGRLVEAMISHRFAHFESFLVGDVVEPISRINFADEWGAAVGGWQGLICTGHADGTVRVWLRAHSKVLLVHTVSVLSLPSLPWRPQLAREVGANGNPRFRPPQCTMWYDGIDACPALPVPDQEGNSISSVAFDAALGMLVAGTETGSVTLFRWSYEPQHMSLIELMEWQINQEIVSDVKGADTGDGTAANLESETHGSPRPPLLPAGFACFARLHQHFAPVTLLRLVVVRDGVHLVSGDCTGLCIVDALTGAVLYYDSFETTPSVLDALSSQTLCLPCAVESVIFSPCILHTRSSMVVDLTREASSELGAYIVLLSSGELGQLSVPLMQLLDRRILESRLPMLPGGPVVTARLTETFLLVVQQNAVHILDRNSDTVSMPRSHQLRGQTSDAAVVSVQDEFCLLVMYTDMVLQVIALPSLCVLSSMNMEKASAQFLPRAAVSSVISPDGYVLVKVGARIWWASCLSDGMMLDAASTIVPAQQIEEASRGWKPPWEAKTPTASSGLFTKLFGTAQRPLRECLSSAPLTSRSQAESKATSAAVELNQAKRLAQERGERISDVADKSQKMLNDAKEFERLARQLKEKNSRWFG